ncbi:MAG TPA: hypothetical protein VMW36_01530 [Patescibacteria group bacterium]|nr:hypothetical protein [Patescibacteria group bacterium]
MKEMIVATVVTKSYQNMAEKYLLATLPKEFRKENIFVVDAPDKYDNCHSNISLLKEFEEFRLGAILEIADEHPGKNLFFIDSDVAFSRSTGVYKEITELLEEYDVLFQFNDSWYNFGIFAFSIDRALSFFDTMLHRDFEKVLSDPGYHDQHLVNDMLTGHEFQHIRHAHLPKRYYANHFHGASYPGGVPENVALLHSTSCSGISSKEAMLEDFKKKYYDE